LIFPLYSFNLGEFTQWVKAAMPSASSFSVIFPKVDTPVGQAG